MMEGLYGPQYSLYDDLPLPPPQIAVEVASNYYHDPSAAFILPPAGTAVPYDNPHGGNLLPAVSSSLLSDDSASSMAAAAEDASLAIVRAKITSHALYPKLVEAYIDCQKVGAPTEVAGVLDEIRRRSAAVCKVAAAGSSSSCVAGADPELDEFMESYCDVLLKYKCDISRPFEEATSFFKKIEKQLQHLCPAATRRRTYYTPDELVGNYSLSEEDEYVSGGEVEMEGEGGGNNPIINEEEEEDDGKLNNIMDKLMQKYSGCIVALKHDFSKKKKRGKLPKEARDILLNWWNLHYKWPYPTETDKVTLAQSTGLDQKQINNWFINQRKRHWRSSENMHFSFMDTLYGYGTPF